MKTGRSIGLLVCSLAISTLSARATAQGEAAAPAPWKLDLEAQRFGLMSVSDVAGRTELRWVLLFTVKNGTSRELPLSLAFRIESDRKKTFIEGFYPKAEASLEGSLGKPLVSILERPKSIAPGQTIEGVAIFGDVDRLTARYDIVVSGLRDPVTVENGKRYLDKRVLVLTYSQPSDEFEKLRAPIRPISEQWRTDGEKKEF